MVTYFTFDFSGFSILIAKSATRLLIQKIILNYDNLKHIKYFYTILTLRMLIFIQILYKNSKVLIKFTNDNFIVMFTSYFTIPLISDNI